MQRVHRASVAVAGEVVGQIGRGVLLLVGVGHDDEAEDAKKLASRVVTLRIFPDDAEKMNLDLHAIGGELLVVSQFTLMGDTRRGRRPSFGAAAAPDFASALVDRVQAEAVAAGVRTAAGRFGAHMDIDIQADGPVTLWLDTKESRNG